MPNNPAQYTIDNSQTVTPALRGFGVAVLIPCYNEAATITKVVGDFHAALPEATIYVYDNASTDDTADTAAAAGAVVRREPRRGKGNVVRSMFRDVDADYYIMVDGDDTYPAEAAVELIAPIVAGDADMTVGDPSPTAPMMQRTDDSSISLATTLCEDSFACSMAIPPMTS